MRRNWLAARFSKSFGSSKKRRRQALGRQVEALEHRTLLSFTLGTSKVRMADDYFAIEQGNLLDYNEAGSPVAGVDDRESAGDDDQNLTNPNVSNGAYNFTSTTSSQIFFLHPGVWDAERQPANRFAGTVPEDQTGETRPIDTSKYYVLNMKITASSTLPFPPTANLSSRQGLFFWDNGRAVAELTATQPYFLFPGTHIYSFDLRTFPTQPGAATNASGPWSGMMAGLRFYPVNVAGVDMSIDWVTLTPKSPVTVPVNLSGVRGTVQVGLSTDGNVNNLIKFSGRTGSWPESHYLEENLVTPRDASTLTSVDVSALSAGTYFLHLLDANGRQVSGTSPQQIIVNAPGSVRIQTPSALGDLSRDYATTVRGDAWDFSQSSDFSIPFLVSPTEYGVPTLVTDPVSGQYGQLSTNGNSWMRYDNFTATNPRYREDPQFLLPISTPFNTSQYKNLTIRMLFDEKRPNSQIGGPLRVGYNDTNPPFGGFSQTDDIIVQDGPQNYSMDLSTVKLEPLFTTNRAYSSLQSINYLRIDPHEYTRNVITYIDHVWLTPNERTTDGRFNLTWSASDLNGDGLTIAKIYLDKDRTRGNGNETVVATNVANTGSFTLDTRNATGLISGTYRVLFELTDGFNTTFEYSTGVLDVNPVGPTGTVPMYRAYNPNANFHFFTTNRVQFDNAVSAGYRDEHSGVTGFSIFSSPAPGSTPLYRVYNFDKGYHYYTLNQAEKNGLIAASPQPGQPGFGRTGWRDEGVEGHMFTSQQPGTTEIYRLYNNQSGVHLFTEIAAAKDGILRQFPGIWVQHDSVGFAYPIGTGQSFAAAAQAAAIADVDSTLDGASGSAGATADAGTEAAGSTPDSLIQTLVAVVAPPAAVAASAPTSVSESPLAGLPVRTADDETSDEALTFLSALEELGLGTVAGK